MPVARERVAVFAAPPGIGREPDLGGLERDVTPITTQQTHERTFPAARHRWTSSWREWNLERSEEQDQTSGNGPRALCGESHRLCEAADGSQSGSAGMGRLVAQ